MTIGQRGRRRRSSLRVKSKMSGEKKEKLHATAEEQLVQMSDVKQELRKKQNHSVQKQFTSIQENHYIFDENHGKPQVRCRHNRRKQWQIEESKCAAGESNHLLILADSAALLFESENNVHHSEMNNHDYAGQNVMRIPMEVIQGIAVGEAEENAVHMQENFRLTQIRRLARLKNHKSKEETHKRKKTWHMYEKHSKDIDCINKVVDDKIEEVTGCQDITAQGVCRQSSSKGKQVCLDELREVNNEGLHQAAPEEHMMSHQLVQITTEPELREQEEVAHQLTLLRTETRSDPSQNQCVGPSLHGQVHMSIKDPIGQVPVTRPQMSLKSEMPQDSRSIARQRRMLRIYERRQQRALAQMKEMYEAERRWLWHTMNLQNGHINAANQQWLFYMSNMQWQQHCFAAQLRKASQTAHNHLYNNQQREHAEEGIRNQNGDAKAEADQYQRLEQVHEQVMTSVEAQRQTSHVKLNRVKREARMKHSCPMDRKHELGLDRQTDTGNKSNEAEGIMLQT